MEWWAWVISGLVLLCAEVFIPAGFYFFIIGIACTTVGLLVLAWPTMAVELQFVLATLVGIAMIFSVRRPLTSAMARMGRSSGSEITAQKVLVLEDLTSGQTGKGELGGTTWNVRNESGKTLMKGQTYSVTRTEGLTLIVLDL